MSKIKRNKTQLILPFKGRWKVYWGGDTKELNRHHDNHVQRFAFDFDKINDEGEDYENKGHKLEDYYAFGEEILAPGDGEIIEATDGIRDNILFSTNPYLAQGNSVIIKHSEKEFSVLAHLKQGSINVKQGDTVKIGQKIGLCGNSGNSSQPHLHYHLQDDPYFAVFTKEGKKPKAQAVKVFFSDVAIENEDKSEQKAEYSPIKDDILIGNYKNNSEKM